MKETPGVGPLAEPGGAPDKRRPAQTWASGDGRSAGERGLSYQRTAPRTVGAKRPRSSYCRCRATLPILNENHTQAFANNG
jgi:hypothetical protein